MVLNILFLQAQGTYSSEEESVEKYKDINGGRKRNAYIIWSPLL